MRKHTARSKALMAIAACIAALATFFALHATVADGATPKVQAPASLLGTWHQTNGTGNGIIMHARITPNSIQINAQTRDSDEIYWLGSFDTSRDPSSFWKTESLVDPDGRKVLNGTLIGSQDDSKEFSYNSGDLSFKFSIVHVTYTIHLAKD